MRKINLKLVACLVVVALLIAGGAYFIRKMNYETKITALHEEAKAAEAEDDLVRAATLYNRYVTFRPNDQDAAR